MKVVIEDVEGQIWVTPKALKTVKVTIEIDLDRTFDIVRRAFRSPSGIATWADKGIRAFVQEDSSQ